MITTLRTGLLTLSTVEYKFDSAKRLTIKLTTTSDHLLWGDVNIVLANALDIDIFKENRVLAEDFFNSNFLFTRTSATTLEFSLIINANNPNITQSDNFITLDNNGSSITATVDNASIFLGLGSWNFLLIDTDTNFSTSTIGITQTNVGKTGVDGVQAEYNRDGAGNVFSINDIDLTFKSTARVELINDVSGITNIPLVIARN